MACSEACFSASPGARNGLEDSFLRLAVVTLLVFCLFASKPLGARMFITAFTPVSLGSKTTKSSIIIRICPMVVISPIMTMMIAVITSFNRVTENSRSGGTIFLSADDVYDQ